MGSYKHSWIIVLVSALLGVTFSASAQTGTTAVLTPPQTDAYPQLSTFLDIHDEGGRFISDLKASQVRLLENGEPVETLSFEEYYPGVQLVVAINPGETFNVRNSQGVSRYDLMSKHLVEWAGGRLGSNLDDISLLFASGPEQIHFTDYNQLLDALTTYKPVELPPPVDLDVLERAIELANDPLPRPGMERAILLITAPVMPDSAYTLQSLSAQADQQGIRFFIWYVASSQLANSPDIDQFTALTSGSDGSFLRFSGSEELPNLENYFSQLRSIYQIRYTSEITVGGEHELVAQINLNGSSIETDPVRFSIDLQPPNPVFLSPQLQIMRSVPPEIQGNLLEEITPADLLPNQQEFTILVEFPDGMLRPLVHSALYVDGVLVDENVKEPFDHFRWNLDSYIESGQHILKIEIQDIYRLKGSSIDMPVELIVDLPAPNPLRGLALRWPLLVGLAAVLITALILVSLILAGRLRPGYGPISAGSGNGRGDKKSKSRKPKAPESGSQSTHGGRLPEWVNHFHWPRRRINPNAHAYLIRLDEDGSTFQNPISIIADEVSFGQDPGKAMHVIDEASIEGLHARLLRDSNDSYVIFDEGSTAGTWVNYQEVGKEGACVSHGDIIHIGRAGFRFTQRKPKTTRKPVITILEPPP